jgi:hypothetical protein
MIAGCGVLITVLGVVATGRWAARTAARTGYLLEAEVNDGEHRVSATA